MFSIDAAKESQSALVICECPFWSVLYGFVCGVGDEEREVVGGKGV